MSITTFQKIELVLIPIVFIFSQILILLFGHSIIGQEIWGIMGFPMLLGFMLSISILVFIQRYMIINEFHQLEVLFRMITIIGGIIVVLIIAMQIIIQVTGYIIFSLQILIISIIGDIMTLLCIMFLRRVVFTQVPSE